MQDLTITADTTIRKNEHTVSDYNRSVYIVAEVFFEKQLIGKIELKKRQRGKAQLNKVQLVRIQIERIQMEKTQQIHHAQCDSSLAYTSDGIDMNAGVNVLEHSTVYQGAIFSVEDLTLALRRKNGSVSTIRREVVHHAPCVMMLVHDTATDMYLLEREYRVGSARFAYGLPAGFMDGKETPKQAALRELREETGVIPSSPESFEIDLVGDYYSSEGMSDEIAHIMVIHLREWKQGVREFDESEHVASSWVSWQTLQEADITESNAVIAVQHETIRRLQQGE